MLDYGLLCLFCSAATYLIKPLYERMRISYKANLYRDVLYLSVDKEGSQFEAFFFPYGVSVFWGDS